MKIRELTVVICTVASSRGCPVCKLHLWRAGASEDGDRRGARQSLQEVEYDLSAPALAAAAAAAAASAPRGAAASARQQEAATAAPGPNEQPAGSTQPPATPAGSGIGEEGGRGSDGSPTLQCGPDSGSSSSGRSAKPQVQIPPWDLTRP